MKKITLCIALLVGFVSHAQWNIDTAVNTLIADSNSGDMKSIGTSDGQTYIVFWKVVAAPTNYELRLQLLDATGTKQFGNDGMLVSNTIPMSTFTSVWSLSIDSSDNLYIGCSGTDDDSGHAFKMNTSGTQLWAITFPSALVVNILPLSSGDNIVSWLSTSAFKATMQKYDSNGNDIWPATQAALSGSSSTSPGDLYEISTGNYIMVFHVIGSGINSTLYAQRFDTDGNAVWTNPTQLSNKTTAFNTTYDGLVDNDIVYYGYIGKSATRFDSYLQRINSDGTLPWGINGMDFDTNETNYEQATKIAYSSGSNYIWAVCSYTNTSQSESGEYVQKFDKTSGARQFTDTAKEIYVIGSENVHAGNLQLVNDQPLFLIKSGNDNGATPTTLNACYLDSNGDFVWPEEIKPMATFSGNKGRIQFVKPVNGQAVTVFIEDKGAGNKIYAQNFTDTALSIDEFNSEISLQYLNPIKNELKLKSNELIKVVSVYNILGQSIITLDTNSNEVVIDSQSWTSGMYFIKISTINGNEKGINILKE
ncbi:MAG: T9SS type A sorting domain-containing protein [Psychroserpens sp.]|uniref:T9SS type A sorting domain-containing protein n=1 Tax=Psychroserpens sp. TaxID=2020870 RepID=UPI00300346D5